MLKNYRSESSLPNIFAAIEKILVSHGAKKISRDYGDNGLITSISFLVPIHAGEMMVRLPARVDRVKAIFDQQGLKYKPEQPYRTAWATLRDWVDAQMALIEWEMVKLEEVFLPYVVSRDGRTYFEVLEGRGFQLGSGTEEGEVLP